MEVSEEDRARGFVIIRLQSAIYVGQSGYNFAVSKDKVPSGFGFLRLDDGSQHQGFFEKGRANGKGVLLTPAGLQLTGEWRNNMRVGEFRAVDASGQQFVETYGADGKRVSRKRLKLAADDASATAEEGAPSATVDAPPLAPASQCWNCRGVFHRQHNNSYACRRHRGNWEVDRTFRGEGEAPGVWTCCALTTAAAQGCAFLAHSLDHSCAPRASS